MEEPGNKMYKEKETKMKKGNYIVSPRACEYENEKCHSHQSEEKENT